MKLMIANISRSLQGGVENIVNDLCLNLPNYGIMPTIGLAQGAKYNLIEPYKREFPQQDITIFNGKSGFRQDRQLACYKAIKTNRPDIVLITRLYDAFEPIIRLKQEGLPIRLAVTIQAFEEAYIYDAKMFNEFIDLCVTSGELVRQSVIEFTGIEASRVINIPGGVKPPLTPRSQTAHKLIRLGYVGRVEQAQKRIMDLPKLLLHLDQAQLNYHLVIAGSGPAESLLLKAIDPWINSGHVNYLGWVDNKQLYQHVYPKLDVLVHFAQIEGVTIAPREAMVHGVVPVISDFLGRGLEGQFINKKNALVFKVGDIEQAVKHIIKLKNEPALFQKLSSQAKLSQAGKYSYDGAIKLWADAFNDVINKPSNIGTTVFPAYPCSGRLEKYGLSSKLAQSVRKLAGRKFLHANGGDEWPTNSGLIDQKSINQLADIAKRLQSDS